MVLTTDDSRGDDACVKVVVETVSDETIVVGASDGDPHVTLKLPSNPSEIQ